MKFYMVGGYVRDQIIGTPSKDIDFTVVLDEADVRLSVVPPFDIMSARLKQMGFKIFLETPDYLTIRAQFPDKGFKMNASDDINKFQFANSRLTADFVLARKESGYTDGRRPDTVEIGTLEDDLARRDFTMNAVARDLEGNLIDPFNGVQDINDRVIRAVGNAYERLEEDALRAVRALRFSITKGFRIDKELAIAMQSPSVIDSLFYNISDERIMDELSKALRYDTKSTIIRMVSDFPVLTGAVLGGKVSFDATMKQKGRGR